MAGATRTDASTPSMASLLALVGGVMVALGSTLDWFGGASVGAAALSVSGVETVEGRLAFACGAAAVVLGVAGAFSRLRPPPAAMTALVVAGALTLALAVYSSATADDRLLDVAEARVAARPDVTTAQARVIVEEAFRSADLSVSVEGGLFLVFAGGALVTAGGAVPMLTRRRASSGT